MQKYTLLDPKVDYIFKQIFGQDNPVCKRLLISLLNAIFERKGSPLVESIEYVNPYLDREYDDDKQSILDIRVRTSDNQSIDIEMQVTSSPYYIKRSLWYWASMYERQLQKSEDYGKLKKCIVVNIVNFNLDLLKGITDYHNVFELKERNNNKKLLDDLEIHYVEIKKMKSNIKDSMDDLDRWSLFLNDVNEEKKKKEIERLRTDMEEIDKATEILELVSQDEKARVKYESRLKWILHENTIVNEAARLRKESEEIEEENKLVKEENKLVKEEYKLVKEETEKVKEKLKRAVSKLIPIMSKEEIANTLEITLEEVEELISK